MGGGGLQSWRFPGPQKGWGIPVGMGVSRVPEELRVLVKVGGPQLGVEGLGVSRRLCFQEYWGNLKGTR